MFRNARRRRQEEIDGPGPLGGGAVSGVAFDTSIRGAVRRLSAVPAGATLTRADCLCLSVCLTGRGRPDLSKEGRGKRAKTSHSQIGRLRVSLSATGQGRSGAGSGEGGKERGSMRMSKSAVQQGPARGWPCESECGRKDLASCHTTSVRASSMLTGAVQWCPSFVCALLIPFALPCRVGNAEPRGETAAHDPPAEPRTAHQSSSLTTDE